MDWEEAFYQQYQDAGIGRLFRGLIHNLNGVAQAFSLQSALFDSMFAQAGKLMQQVVVSEGQDREAILKLQSLLRSRSQMVGQMEQKVETCKNILSRTMPLGQLYQKKDDYCWEFSRIVQMEMDFLAADSFFKHKVEKRVELALNLPAVCWHAADIHTILYCLLGNAIEAMYDSGPAIIDLKIWEDSGSLMIQVIDTGCGIDPGNENQIFEAFFTTKEERLGVGLYFAAKLISAMSGTIHFVSEPGRTCFTVALPAEDL